MKFARAHNEARDLVQCLPTLSLNTSYHEVLEPQLPDDQCPWPPSAVIEDSAAQLQAQGSVVSGKQAVHEA